MPLSEALTGSRKLALIGSREGMEIDVFLKLLQGQPHKQNQSVRVILCSVSSQISAFAFIINS